MAIPAVMIAATVAASSLANKVHWLAVADVRPVAADITSSAASVPLSSEPVTATIAPAAPAADVPKMDAPAVDAPVMSAPVMSALVVNEPVVNEPVVNEPVVKGPVLAALQPPDEKLSPQPLEKSNHQDEIAGPTAEQINQATNVIPIDDECLVMETCVDRYLFQLYQRTAKEDSIKETTQHRVTIKKKGKLKTVTRSTTIVIDEDFGWKDPKAAKHVDMPLADYVIGGVDRSFKLRLFQMLHAADQAGFAPGITSAFRDDYRQSIASGLKAADNRSYHGGSLRGGYGHGLAADIVSTRGATRADRLRSSEALWKWVDDHGTEFGLGRPYLDRDPPHVAPIDGEEFAHHRPEVKARQIAAQTH